MFAPILIHEMRKHARAEYPREAVGLVVGGEYVRLKNTHANPEKFFDTDPEEVAQYSKTGKLEAMIHSHPKGPQWPSRADMAAQIAWGIPFGIVACSDQAADKPFFWGDGVAIPDFIGRPFRHGVTDCYSLIRDWWRVHKKFTLPEIPRDWLWWERGADMYTTALQPAGFVALEDGQELKAGDGFLSSVGSETNIFNHAGIFIGNGSILHHVSKNGLGYDAGSPSRRTVLEAWTRTYPAKWFRHQSIGVLAA